jgi:phosphoribosylanthranilate isomerase
MTKDLIQIAGIIDVPEARMLMECGVNYLGFPLRLPVHRDDLTENEASEVIKEIIPPFKAVLISYLNDGKEIIKFCDKLNVKVVQLHGKIALEELKIIKQLRPDIEIIKSLVVSGDNYSDLADLVFSLSSWVDSFITDTFDPATGASGATGKTHDWNISKKLVELSPKPIILAGGLNPSNVRMAILEIKPAGVDVHTGVEGPDGRKDYDLVKEFVTEAKRAFDEINKIIE